MPEFFQTGMGKRFYEGQLPRLIKALERIAVCLEDRNEESQRPSESDRVPKVPINTPNAASGSD